MHRRTTVLVALPQPRHATSAAADVAASHSALNGTILPIEGARTHAPAISTGALDVFRAFQHAQPGLPLRLGVCLVALHQTFACSKYIMVFM
jgi:hypothetical protein